MKTEQISIVNREKISIVKGLKVKIQVRTIYSTYTGDLFVPPKRNRFSDVINDTDTNFISLTDVTMDGTPGKIEHLLLNKSLIESVRLDEQQGLLDRLI